MCRTFAEDDIVPFGNTPTTPSEKCVEPVSNVILLLVVIFPPPLKPFPLPIVIVEWSICSFATKFVVESWSICADSDTVPLGNIAGICEELETIPEGSCSEPLNTPKPSM